MTNLSISKTRKFIEDWIDRGNDNHSNKTKEFLEDWIENDTKTKPNIEQTFLDEKQYQVLKKEW